MLMINSEIYSINSLLMDTFKEEDNKHYFSAKINFLIQKNKKNIMDAAITIEKVRMEIINKYQDKDTKQIAQENIEKANQELQDLLDIEQDVTIFTLPFEALDGVEFTAAQAKALMFMIEDPKEEEE